MVVVFKQTFNYELSIKNFKILKFNERILATSGDRQE